MPGTSPFTINPRQLTELKQRFKGVNDQRLRSVQNYLRADQQGFLDLLPLLFHTNSPNLPGYVDDATPAGLAEYQPSPRTMEVAKGIDRSFQHKRKAFRYFDIESLFAMGSAGSVAYSEKSDFDMWLCYRHGLEPKGLEALQKKCTLIEKWGESLGLEVHFFLMDAEEFRSGKQVELSSESSGSAQYHLLLDEFYRTGLLLAGRYPVWWLVPAEHEGDYEAYVATLVSEGHIGVMEIIDFGGLGHIPAEEFYGAGVWQVYKGIGSPYKSTLKILLMEVYTSDFPNIELLSVTFKRKVWEGESDMAALDPYLLLNERLENYLKGKGDEERLELMRRCFYFKVDEHLSRPNLRKENQARYDTLTQLATSWGWNRAQLFLLDSRLSWKVERVQEERRSVVGALHRTYHHLSDFARQRSAENMIDPRDLHILARKLYSAFERKAGKIDLVNPGISNDMAEAMVTLYRTTGDQEAWFLYRGDLKNPDDRKRAKPLKRSKGLIELIAWSHFNGVIDERSQIKAYSRDNRLDQKDVMEVLSRFRSLFPNTDLPSPSMAELEMSRPRITAASIFINAGIDVLPAGAATPAQLAKSGDIFCFGTRCDNLVRSVDLILINNWKEILTFHHSGDEAVIGAAAEYLSILAESDPESLTAVESHCFSFFQGTAINRRVKGIFEQIVNSCLSPGRLGDFRYVMHIGRNYHYLQHSPEGAVSGIAKGIEELYQVLEQPCERYISTLFASSGFRDTPLPAMLATNRPGVVQFFYSPAGPVADVYVLDEKGSLFRQSCEYRDAPTLLSQFHRFFSAVLPRRGLDFSTNPMGEGEQVEYYQIGRNAEGKWELDRHGDEDAEQARRYFNVQVIGEAGDGGRNLFTIYCNDQEFSSLEHGNRLFTEIAHSVLARRQGGERYPIYITDIDISRMLNRSGRGEIQTIQFLNYKKRIEETLNKALQQV